MNTPREYAAGAALNPVLRRLFVTLLALVCLSLAGCSGNVGVGLSVGVPVGDHGYVSVGGGRWL